MATTTWQITFDCADPAKLADFWALALGYVRQPPPDGYRSWDEYYRDLGLPEEELTGSDDEWAYLVDPEGIGPRLSFLPVPEPKTAKNRLHMDLKVGGGRDVPIEERWPRVQAMVDRLVTAGATVIRQDEFNGVPDHVVMADPEGNEFCVV